MRGFDIAHEFRGMSDVAERTTFLVERGGTVRRAWRHDPGEVPNFDELQFLSDWNGDATRGFGVAHDFRGMKDVSERSTFLVGRGGTVRRAWRHDPGEVPDFDELLAAARAL